MDECDDLVSTGFDLLADPSVYVIAPTGERRDVGVIPIDEAETWQARKGDLEIKGGKVIARLYGDQMPDGWTGPETTGRDRLECKGRLWRVQQIREELNRVWVVNLTVARTA